MFADQQPFIFAYAFCPLHCSDSQSCRKREKMIRCDKKVALRKHLERLTLSDVRDGSGGRVQLVATGSQGFRSEPRKRLVVPAPAFEARRSIEETFCLPAPSSEPAVRRPVICPATTSVHVRDLSRHLAFLGATCLRHRWFQDSARHRQCRSASSVNVLHLSRVSPRFPTICDAPVQFFPSGATFALEPGVN